MHSFARRSSFAVVSPLFVLAAALSMAACNKKDDPKPIAESPPPPAVSAKPPAPKAVRFAIASDGGKLSVLIDAPLEKFKGDLIDRAKIKCNEDENHLFFWDQFSDFLSKDGFFQGFKETDITHNPSRNTIAHGKLEYEQFSRLLAIKVILILDQIYNFIT